MFHLLCIFRLDVVLVVSSRVMSMVNSLIIWFFKTKEIDWTSNSIALDWHE